ncbi:MAG: hypothetical protein HQM11_13800 [SAR324 cluster bacterium]|nr:hypothetical protein [SAR324 cluster bacterium]
MRDFLCLSTFILIGLTGISGNSQIHANETITVSEILEQTRTIIKEREQCFTSHGDLNTRLRDCRKQYMRNILLTAQKGKGKPQLGKFLICLRECPIELALCRGDLELELHSEPCVKVETECVKKCLIDYYW